MAETRMQARRIQEIVLSVLRELGVRRVWPSRIWSLDAEQPHSALAAHGFDPEWMAETARETKTPDLRLMQRRPWNRNHAILACLATRDQFSQAMDLCRQGGVHLNFEPEPIKGSSEFYYEVIATQFVPGRPPRWVPAEH